MKIEVLNALKAVHINCVLKGFSINFSDVFNYFINISLEYDKNPTETNVFEKIYSIRISKLINYVQAHSLIENKAKLSDFEDIF